MRDNYTLDHDPVFAPATRWAAVVPSDTNDLPEVPKALRVNGAGTISVVGADGHAEDFAVAAGETLAIRAVRVRVSGTSATGIKALY